MNNWHRVAPVEDFEVELVEEFKIAGFTIAVHPTTRGFYATAAICTHEHARLYDGLLEGVEIQCPRHMARFDVRTGAVLCPPAVNPLPTYPCEVRDDALWVQLPDAEA